MVENFWSRMHAQLALHAPELFASLRPPASKEDVAAAEAAFGSVLPQEIKDAYLAHDGCTATAAIPRYNNLLGSHRWMPLSEALSLWRQNVDLYEECQDDETMYPPWFDETTEANRVGEPVPGWFPIAEAGAQRNLYVDLDPGPKGHRGQIVWHDVAGGQGVFAPSLNEYLLFLLEGLEQGHIFYDKPNLGWTDRRTGLPPKVGL